MIAHVFDPRRCLMTLLAMSLVLAPATALARGSSMGEPPPAPIADSIARATARWPAEWVDSGVAEVRQAQGQGNWIARHPALFGALVGWLVGRASK
jgi:hypothetical protein